MVGYRIAPGSAVLRGDALPGRVRLAMVVREGRVLLPEDAEALMANDYAYFLAPTGQAPRLDWLFAEGSDARVAEQDLFGSFALPGDVPLGELASFYNLQIPSRSRCDRRAVVRRTLRRTTAGRRPPHARQGGAGGARAEGRARVAGGAEVRRRRRAVIGGR
jgi:NhaP-type Na+/H+ and K+/H+ antiporter